MSTARFAAHFVNRNPRNLELLGKQRRPAGYQFEADRERRSFTYKVELVQSKSHQEARLWHYRDGLVMSASTKEKAISSQLYSNTDSCASLNIGRVLALRCLKAGIHFAMPAATEDHVDRSTHQREFLKALEMEGLTLSEPLIEEHSYSNDKRFTWLRYPIKNTREDKLDEL